MKSNRRTFLKEAGLLSLSLPILTATGCKTKNEKSTVESAVEAGFSLDEFGIQLWSVRDFMEKDAKGTLAQLGKYGYNTIESFQGAQGVFWGMKPMEYKSFLNDNNLKTLSTHCDPQYCLDLAKRDEFKKLVDDSAEIGTKYLVNPWMAQLKTLDEFKHATDGMNALGEICASYGLQYCYHNHAYSFSPIDGVKPQNLMMDGTAGGPVGFEMDVYWVVAAKEDPIEWLNKYPGRFVLSHVKDRYKEDKLKEIQASDGTEKYEDINGSCVLGKGQIDFDEVLKVAKKQGMKKYIVEQERYDDMTSMDAAKLDADFMKKYRV